ncbi:MAG TPA: hypothetical protein VKA94_13495, partial [Hyphomicrobiales bacterium]|nr:hypothetical protein [Hyphomicrobiales bacterium]
KQIRLNSRNPLFPYNCFKNEYKDTVPFRRAMDRSNLEDTNGASLRDLWNSVTDDVIAATRELWNILGWIEEDDDDPEPITRSRAKILSPVDDLWETPIEAPYGD